VLCDHSLHLDSSCAASTRMLLNLRQSKSVKTTKDQDTAKILAHLLRQSWSRGIIRNPSHDHRDATSPMPDPCLYDRPHQTGSGRRFQAFSLVHHFHKTGFIKSCHHAPQALFSPASFSITSNNPFPNLSSCSKATSNPFPPP
jgi:hypothetical protein